MAYTSSNDIIKELASGWIRDPGFFFWKGASTLDVEGVAVMLDFLCFRSGT